MVLDQITSQYALHRRDPRDIFSPTPNPRTPTLLCRSMGAAPFPGSASRSPHTKRAEHDCGDLGGWVALPG
jgi:hypothetical protein